MKEYFNIKGWQLIVTWIIVLIVVSAQEEAYTSNDFLIGVTPTLLMLYTLGWLGFRNSNRVINK